MVVAREAEATDIDEHLRALFAHTADPAWLKAHGLFVAEGRLVTTRLLESPRFRTVALLLTPTAEAAMAPALHGVSTDRRPYMVVVPSAELDALTGFRLHQGCVAFAERISPDPWRPNATARGLSVLLERVRDPDNVGSIARSVAGLGGSTLLLGPECADPFYRKAVRTSMGAVLSLPLFAAVPWPGVLAEARDAGITLIATVTDSSALLLDDVADQLGSGPAVLMVGSEGEGLSEQARDHAHVVARIPMAQAVDSLNVAVATAIAVYALRRRERR